MNIENTLNNAVRILNKSKIKNSILDSEILLSQVINRDRKYIFLNSKKNLKQKYLKNFNNLIVRRRKGEPVAYLINKKEFWKQSFYVDQNVLIPRPDTELIIEQVLKLFLKNSKLQILDIGTGSGCILLSLLKEMPNCYGTGIDISKKSINISNYNAKMLQLTNKVKFYQSDVDNFKIGKYDLIVSNPPYIEELSLKYLENDVIYFEPKLALNGGIDGFSKIRKVIDKATVLIKKNGKLVLEIGFNQKNKVQEMLRRKGFYINKTIKDYGKKDRCIISTKI
ncbi:MAG: peptide chain release factor N(5)-glutamine methyltransferase [Pelagibacterales bacterium]|nr:peptide chain release factor N(5)-glutamine methyltransferase [Pelagibacterales bacterium]